MSHPHAKLMAEYAQDAAETDTPWERWELCIPTFSNNAFHGLDDHPRWEPDRIYRRKKTQDDLDKEAFSNWYGSKFQAESFAIWKAALFWERSRGKD